MTHHHEKKHSFLPYIAMIVVAIIIISVVNAASVYYANLATEQRDHEVISNQQQIITTMAKDYSINNQILNKSEAQLNVNMLYHGQLLYILNNQSKILNSLVDSHNQMIQAIANATHIHTPIINNNKNTFVHNSYCTINQVYVPPSCKGHPHK